MKKIIFIFVLTIFTLSLSAQNGVTKPSSKPAAKSVVKKPAPSPLKNMLDSASYAIGLSVASYYKQQGVNKLNSTVLTKGINDVLNNKPLLFDDYAANNLMNNFMNNLQKEKSIATIKEGETFLKINKTKPGVKTTASGLQYEIMKDTVGYKPNAADTFVVEYSGKLLNGFEFDNSRNRGQPLIMPVSKVIPGWIEGLQLMSIGSKYKFYVPYELGYGLYGNEPDIPGGSMLIFDLELLDVKKQKKTGGQ
jgi:FKBP-type peptidyl-prolyl cis-trans isomerase FklB